MKKLSVIAFIVLISCYFISSGYSISEIGKSGKIVRNIQIVKAEENDESKAEQNQIDIVRNNSIEQAITSWATAYCNRDGNALYQLFDPDNKNAFFQMKNVNSSKDDNNIIFGESSPWPWETDYEYSIDGNTAEITYYAKTSEPHIYTWIEKLKFTEKDNRYYVSSEQLMEYDSVLTKEELEESIFGNFKYYANRLNIINTNLSSILNQNAGKGKTGVYAPLFSPETAGPYLLNLSEGSCVVKKKYLTCTIITYTFKNGAKIDIQMTQPFGRKGIWLVEDVDVKDLEGNLQKIDDWFKNINIKKLNKCKTVIDSDDLAYTHKGSTILLASIPKEKVYMYGYGKGNAVILRVNNKYQLFRWEYTSPRLILPKIGYADYDQDGKKEIAVSVCTGTGTGVSVDQLYLVKTCSDGKMQVVEFTQYQYISQLKERVTSQYNETKRMLQFYIDNKKAGNAVDISSWIKEGYKYLAIGFGEQISFDITKKGIMMNFIPGCFLDKVCSPQYDEMPNFTAKVEYQNSGFKLSDIKLNER